jgi:hypothetical protein
VVDRELELKILIEAKRRLLENGWTKRAFARNSQGVTVGWEDPSAACFCVSGAVRRAVLDIGGPPSMRPEQFNYCISILDQKTRAKAGINIIDFNDSDKTTLDEVVEVFDQAIATVQPPLTESA